MAKRRPGSDARKAFEKLLHERHPEFLKAKSDATYLSLYVQEAGPGRFRILTFQNDKDGQARFTIEVARSETPTLPPFLGREENARLRLGELVDGRDLWWDLRPPAPRTQAERALLLPKMPAHLQLLLGMAPAGDDLLWDSARSDLVQLMSAEDYRAAVAGTVRDAVEKIERYALPWFEGASPR